MPQSQLPEAIWSKTYKKNVTMQKCTIIQNDVHPSTFEISNLAPSCSGIVTKNELSTFFLGCTSHRLKSLDIFMRHVCQQREILDVGGGGEFPSAAIMSRNRGQTVALPLSIRRYVGTVHNGYQETYQRHIWSISSKRT